MMATFHSEEVGGGGRREEGQGQLKRPLSGGSSGYENNVCLEDTCTTTIENKRPDPAANGMKTGQGKRVRLYMCGGSISPDYDNSVRLHMV